MIEPTRFTTVQLFGAGKTSSRAFKHTNSHLQITGERRKKGPRVRTAHLGGRRAQRVGGGYRVQDETCELDVSNGDEQENEAGAATGPQVRDFEVGGLACFE